MGHASSKEREWMIAYILLKFYLVRRPVLCTQLLCAHKSDGQSEKERKKKKERKLE